MGEIDSELKSLREAFSIKVFYGTVLLVAVGLPVSLSRWWMSGEFIPIYAAHICLSAWVIALLFIYKKLNPVVVPITNLVLYVVAAMAAVFTFGITATPLAFLCFSTFFSAMYWGRTVGLLVFLGFLGFYVLAAKLFVTEALTPGFDLNAYVRAPTSWIANIVAGFIPALMLILASAQFRQRLEGLTEKITKQKQEIEYMANHDALTGLPTLRLIDTLLDKALSHAKRHQIKTALLYMDLDGFKAINDKYGHATGDIILKVVAERLSQTIRSEDVACRIGGDEFLILLPCVENCDSVKRACDRILAEISKPILAQGANLKVTASIGAALFPDHAYTSSEMKKCADQVMYEIKHNGKCSFKVANHL